MKLYCHYGEILHLVAMLLSVYIERYIIEVEAVSVNTCPSLNVRDEVTYSHKNNELNYAFVYSNVYIYKY
jgi:hypothetical protein